MPQQIALYVEAFFAVGTEKGLLARVRSLVDDHRGVARKLLLAYVAQLLMIVYPLRLGRRRVVHQRQLLLRVFRLYVTHPLLRRGIHVAAQVALERRKLLVVVGHVVLRDTAVFSSRLYLLRCRIHTCVCTGNYQSGLSQEFLSLSISLSFPF